MLTRGESRVIIILIALLFIGTIVNIFGRYRESENIEISRLIEHPELKIPELQYSSSNQPSSTESGEGYVNYASEGESSIVKINSASTAELISLPGIGPVKAQRIIEYRDKNGKFRNVKDFLKVKGIGPKTLESISPFIDLE
ncbi:MAG: hypothetical protein GF315_06745 [candidate division Zixibacteria bacterium]|nr:hypothetical protein [candidate division Zixibacteria bacterium]